MLVAQFLLGMGLNVIGEPEASTPMGLKVLSWVLLTLHVFVAIGLVVAGIRLWRLRDEEPAIRGTITLGGAGLIVAIIGGILTVLVPSKVWAELFSYVMAIGFI